MRNLIRAFLMIASCAALQLALDAQWGPPEGPWRPPRVHALIDRVHEDLNRGYATWRLSGGDRGRLDHAEHELREFAIHWERGRFDKGNLDDAIGSIQHVIDNNHFNGRERDRLWEDVTQLRRMREAYDRHEIGRW